MELPDVAISWMAGNASSNSELANISNVCRRWREIAMEAVINVARDSLEEGEDAAAPLLLLPSLLRHMMTHGQTTNNNVESYCLAWFTPSGIKFKQVPVDPDDDIEDDGPLLSPGGGRGDESAQNSFAPGGEHLYAGSEDENKTSSRRFPSRSTTPTASSLNARLMRNQGNDKFVNCLYQWDGLQDPEDVLCPFGYARSFIENIIERTGFSDRMSISGGAGGPNCELFGDTSSFAARGATVARPEGYCMCWEHDDIMMLAARAKESEVKIEKDELDVLVRRRRRRRRELHREVLPKVLSSAPLAKNGRIQCGIEQPCVQFLNVDSSHAVRLFTPPFKTGSTPTPITVFCVGIATEDGCFMSGLKRRFEIGHLYPETLRDDLIERSPICLCADAGEANSANEGNEDTRDDNGDENMETKEDESYNSDDSSCDMSMERGRGERPLWKCVCPFTGLDDFVNADQDKEDDVVEPKSSICRGSLGPGSWHCYVAIFDGVASSIRIDGEQEIVRSDFPPSSTRAMLDGLTIGADHTFDMSLCFGEGSEGEGEGAIAELAVFKGRLDLHDIVEIETRLMKKYGIEVSPLPAHERSGEDKYYRLAHALLSNHPGHKLMKKNTEKVPLKYMTKHRLVAWRQTNPVSGEPVSVQRIGTKLGDSSSDF